MESNPLEKKVIHMSDILEMRLLLCAILVILPIHIWAGCFGKFDKTPKRDYANKIGMICLHKHES